MKSKAAVLVALFVVLAITVIGGASVAQSEAASSSSSRKIVILKSGYDRDQATARFERAGATKIKDLPLVEAVVVSVPNEAAARAISRDQAVARVEDDITVQALGKPAKTTTTLPAQIIPWGIDLVEADLVWSSTTMGEGIKVGVIDTGIDTSHPDLRVAGGFRAVAYTSSWKDDNGHGSHVAGTIAALDNTYGVVGAAPNVELYAVKVLDRRGSGYLSDIIEGLDWCISHGMNVVNMSLGTPTYNAVFASAIQKTAAAGVVHVAAAGNSGPGENTVNYPAKFPQTIAVGAINRTDVVASFSSRGPEVDLAAPGVSIYSTYKGGTYATLSGTSMAAPHVAGVAALVLTTDVGSYDENGNGDWDPAEVQAKLQDTATDLGAPNRDDSYGYGLVRADLAVK